MADRPRPIASLAHGSTAMLGPKAEEDRAVALEAFRAAPPRVRICAPWSLPDSRRADQTEAQPLPFHARTSTVARPPSTRIRL